VFNLYNIYETERLILKVIDDSYANQVLDYFTRNKEHLKNSDPLRSESFYTIESRKKALKQELIDIDNGKQLRLWLFKKDDKALKNIRFLIILSCRL